MKKVIIAMVVSNFAFGQIAIGKTSVDGSAILDFKGGTTKGLILPHVIDSSTMTPVTPGTIVFDRTTAKVQYNDGAWKELTIDAGTLPTTRLPGSDLTTGKVVMGASSSSADGVLVLESATKAMILPLITDPVTNVKSAYAGMICYDPSIQMMCVYNGKDWFFWN